MMFHFPKTTTDAMHIGSRWPQYE